MMNTRFKRFALALLMQGTFVISPLALAQSSGLAEFAEPTLPANAVAVLSQTPAYQAALQGIAAERSVHRQLRTGAQEWTGTLSTAQRTQTRPTREQTSEWELLLERNLRLAGKADAYDRVGSSRVEQARALRHKVWREQARLLLDSQGGWLRAQESARVWALQVALLSRQVEAVSKRQKLGDAARIEQQLAEAALAQAQAQAQAADSRAGAARESLALHFPGLLLAAMQQLPPPQALPDSDAQWLALQEDHSPELDLARSDSAAAQAQMRLESAETRPDPRVGVRIGRAVSGAENVVGVVFSMPFGGEHRSAAAAAAVSRAEATVLRQADAQRRSQADATQRLREARTAYTFWLGNADAAQRLAQAADGLQRGYQLGEGSLSDVLSARRLANEQQLAAALGAVDAWQSRHRLELESRLLWAEPDQLAE